MDSYLASLERRLEREEPFRILWEVADAFAEIDCSTLPPAMRRLADLARFSRFDAIAPWLRSERAIVCLARDYARDRNETALASLLDDALDGHPQPPARFHATLPGQPSRELDVPQTPGTTFDGKDWSGTDIALSFAMDGFHRALVRDLAAAAGAFDLQPPAAMRRRHEADARVAAEARDAAAQLRALVASPAPTLEVGDWASFEQELRGTGRRIPVTHRANPPAPPDRIARLAERHGPAARDLLAMLAVHDGAELFVHGDTCGFVLVDSDAWDALRDEAIEWAQAVTWQDEPEAIPACLRSAIPFGKIPGDSESWLLVTEGEHAGCVMLSDTDMIEDRPRYASLAHFMAALREDSARILNCGGFVRYRLDGEECVALAYHPR